MSRNSNHSVRIIAGQWRGRKLQVLDADGLRPSKDIVRETLFNWLQPLLPGSRCLDAFAGSGALGFEAASRDAAEVVMIERSPRIANKLKEIKLDLHANQVAVHLDDATTYLQGSGKAFDIVFLDPPFAKDMLVRCCKLLVDGNWLHAGSRIYLEAARKEGLPELPVNWSWLRQKRTGDVVYGLAVIAN